MRKTIGLICMIALVLGFMVPTFGEASSLNPESPLLPEIEVPTITIINNNIELWHMIEFSVKGAPTTDKAWIGLFEYVDPTSDQEYGWSDGYTSKIMVKNLGTTPYFEPAKHTEPQKYVIAMFDAYGFELTPIVISEVIQVGPMYHGPNSFLPEEKEAAHKHSLLISEEKRKNTYTIKNLMNKGECNPYITDEEVAKYQAFLASDTIHEYEYKNIQDADGKWSQVGPSPEWLSYGDDYIPYDDPYWDTIDTSPTQSGPVSQANLLSPAQGKGKIMGMVVNDMTNQGMPNMDVICYKDGYEFTRTVTDASGTYSFELDPGIYDFECTINDMDFFGFWDLSIEADMTLGYDIFIFIE